MGRRIQNQPEYYHGLIKVRLQMSVLEDIEMIMARDMINGSRQDFIAALVLRGVQAYEDTRRYVLEGIESGALPQAAAPWGRYEKRNQQEKMGQVTGQNQPETDPITTDQQEKKEAKS